MLTLARIYNNGIAASAAAEAGSGRIYGAGSVGVTPPPRLEIS